MEPFDIFGNSENVKNIYNGDVVRIKNSLQLGEVIQHSENEDEDDFDSDYEDEDGDDFGEEIENKNEDSATRFRVRLLNGDEVTEVAENIDVVDRGFSAGDYVAAVSDPTAQMGIVFGVDINVDLLGEGQVVKDKSSRDLKRIKPFIKGDTVVCGPKIGIIRRADHRVIVRVDDGSICTFGPDLYATPLVRIFSSNHMLFYPGQRVKVKYMKSWGEGTVIIVDVPEAYIEWFPCMNTDTGPVERHSSDNLVRLFDGHEDWWLGCRCLLESRDRAFIITHITTKVHVVWQDGKIHRDLPSTSLFHRARGYHDYFPEHYVVEKAVDCDETLDPKRVGVVRSVNVNDRTACVRWLKADGLKEFGEEEVVSVYELEKHADYDFCYGNIVARRSPVSSSSLFGTIIWLSDGDIDIRWFDGQIFRLDPEEVDVICLDGDVPEVNDTAGRETVEEYSNEEGNQKELSEFDMAKSLSNLRTFDLSEPSRNDSVLKFKNFDVQKHPSDHHFARSDGQNIASRKKEWHNKVLQDLDILDRDLPGDIYVRAFEDRMDLLRAVIVGPHGTPYQDGLFLFDFLLPPQYPAVPPLVYYHSGGWQINPNLSAEGGICLSLLNTMTGSGNEVWLPSTSTILQVLVSLQGLVLNSNPYFNEDGHEEQLGTSGGESNSISYNEHTFIVNCKTMLRLMRNPPKGFEELIREHFRKRGPCILGACNAYVNGQVIGSSLSKVVSVGGTINRSSSVGFRVTLTKLVPQLFSTLSQVGADCRGFEPQ